MSNLIRLRPDPIPAIHPVPEFLADAELKAKYDDMKAVFNVPWMGVVTMAYAHYPNFYNHLWATLRPVCESLQFSQALDKLRTHVEQEVAALSPPQMANRLSELGYAQSEIDQIDQIIEAFSHGNFRYLMIATMTRLLLEGEELPQSGIKAEQHATQQAKWTLGVPFVLMEAHHADEPTQQVFEDIKETLGLPFVNTDYRAFARWPSYFALAWGDLKLHIATERHNTITLAIHDQALQLLKGLPQAEGLTSASLRAAAKQDAPVEEVLQMARLFQWLLPGLVTNVAFFRHQLL